MRALIQRVTTASVTIDQQEVAAIGQGMLVFLGVAATDSDADLDYVIQKILGLRIFADHQQKMNLDLNDVDGELLLVSQFTLLANTKKGNRPSYIEAGSPDFAMAMYDKAVLKFRFALQERLKTGKFGADMKVNLVNDGPVTLWIDSKNRT